MDKEKGLPKRKDIRLKNFDYSSAGAYFITICVEKRCKILSDIVGEGSPLPRLRIYGEIAEKWIKDIPQKYPTITVDYYVIMPNHIHLLLSVAREGGRGDPSPTVKAAMGWLKYQATKEINNIRGKSGERFFQRSFYDHIVRNQKDYEECYKYIYENPIKWKFDELYCELGDDYVQ